MTCRLMRILACIRADRMRIQLVVAAISCACTGLLWAVVTHAAEGNLVFLVNTRNSQKLDEADAKRLFVGDTVYWPGNVPVHPVLRPAETPAGVAFYQALHVAPSRFKRMWQEKQLSGQAQAPESIAAPATLLAKIASDPGAIGFALSTELPAKLVGVRGVTLH
jgi:hypothetical protein